MACGGQRLGRRRVAPPLPSSLTSGLFEQQQRRLRRLLALRRAERRRLRGLLALRRAERRRQCRRWTDLQVALAASCSVSPVVAAASATKLVAGAVATRRED
ncbi:hypothetical protein EUGRSUZ_K00595 [Eucalyptus grandis]|uniref:Uncharacterized protein n=2 Tax=Eucalyptus grandis TaxID=71139 RepID=A0ACC3IQT7_EUCGR|nr:hypothetical protein EUGRSUZ_K00595 [Eucalyptus grandis]